MIQINDMFRLRLTHQSHWNTKLWHLEEWTPTERIQGRWQRVTKRLDRASMDRLLERMQCPAKPLEQFRAMM